LCKERIGGGKIGLVTHAVFWHNWKVKEVQDKAEKGMEEIENE